MLVLSRRQGERVVINDNIVVTVLEVRGDRIRLGFEGPSDVPIHREELHRRLSGEQRQPADAGQFAAATV